MSGIEIAGLVLGAAPIIISVLSGGDVKGLIPFRKRRHVATLANALVLQRQTIAETIRLLIVHSGGVHHGDRSESQLDEDPIGYLDDEYIQHQILDFLGETNNAALTGTLHQSNDILKRVARQLAGLVPAHKGQPDDLLGIIEANNSGKRQQADVLPRIKLMLSSSEIKKSIEDLDSVTNSLCRFSQLVLMNRSESLATDPSRKAIRLARALRQIRSFAIDLYAALDRCCRGGSCHSKHEANLFLEDRIDAADQILRSGRNQERNDAPALVFQLIFEASLSASTQSWWHEMPIQVLNKTETEHGATADLASVPSRVKIVVPSPEVTPVPTKAGLALIDNICAAITAAKQGNQPIAFVLFGNSQIGTITTEEITILPGDKRNRITLKAILSNSESIPYGIGYSLRQRMLLALQLASNLLQLSQTRWLCHAWSKETVCFLIRRMGKGDRPSVNFSRAFVAATIDGPEPDAVSCGPNVEPKVVLLELGILLLEIWHQKTLEMHFHLDETPTNYYLRLARAMEWLHDNENPPQALYESAISYCIVGINSKAHLLGWDTNELWNEVCRSVIEPLSKNCKQWR